MEILLNREGGVPIKDQLVAQLELKILGGDLEHGEKLPSVRALARRLKIHHNTVSAAYQALESSGHVELQKGSGVYVRGAGPSTLGEARGLDEMIRLALHAAFRKGFSGVQIRAAVERWLAAVPPDRIVVVDPAREMSELLVHELTTSIGLPATACSLDDVAKNPALVAGALALVLPYHVETLSRLVPGASIETLLLEAAPEVQEEVATLPAGAIVLVVTHSPTVIPFANVILKTKRGEDLLIESRLLTQTREWRRLVPAADMVFADALSVATVKKARPRRLREFRVISQEVWARLREALTIVSPAAK